MGLTGLAVAVAGTVVCASVPSASAQTGAELSLATDDLFRGHSLSEGRPVARGELSYDHNSGVYAGVAIAAVATRYDGIEFLNVQENVGYAYTVTPSIGIDLGLVGYTYGKSYSGGREVTYFEPYLGVTFPNFTIHVHYAPDYLSLGQATIYADIEANRAIARHVHLNLHLGVLAPVQAIVADGPVRSQFDWRAGVSIDKGGFALRFSLAGLGPGADYYAGEYHGHTKVILGISHIF